MGRKFHFIDKRIFLWKRLFKIKGRQFMDPLKIPKYYQERGFEIINAKNPGDVTKNTIKVYDMANPYIPPKIDWIEYFKQKPVNDYYHGFNYTQDIPLTDGIKQAQILTNTMVIKNKLPTNYKNLFDDQDVCKKYLEHTNPLYEKNNKEGIQAINTNSTKSLIQKQVEERLADRLKAILYQACKWDSRYKLVEPIVRDKFRLSYVSIRSVPENVTSEVFANNLFEVCQSLNFILRPEQTSTFKILSQNEPLEIITYHNGTVMPNILDQVDESLDELDINNHLITSKGLPFNSDEKHPIRFKLNNTLIAWADKPLRPFIDLKEALGQGEFDLLAMQNDELNIFPLSPFLDLQYQKRSLDHVYSIQNNNQPIVYEDTSLIEPNKIENDVLTPNITTMPFKYPHFIYDALPHRKWTTAQYAAQGMMVCYAQLASLAKKLYGNTLAASSPLPQPLSCNYVGSNGHNVCTVSFQMNVMPDFNAFSNPAPSIGNLPEAQLAGVTSTTDLNSTTLNASPPTVKNMAWVTYQRGTGKEKELAFVDYNFHTRFLKEQAEADAKRAAEEAAREAEKTQYKNTPSADGITGHTANYKLPTPDEIAKAKEIEALLAEYNTFRADLYKRYDLETSQFVDLNPGALQTMLSLYYYE